MDASLTPSQIVNNTYTYTRKKTNMNPNFLYLFGTVVQGDCSHDINSRHLLTSHQIQLLLLHRQTVGFFQNNRLETGD